MDLHDPGIFRLQKKNLSIKIEAGWVKQQDFVNQHGFDLLVPPGGPRRWSFFTQRIG